MALRKRFEAAANKQRAAAGKQLKGKKGAFAGAFRKALGVDDSEATPKATSKGGFAELAKTVGEVKKKKGKKRGFGALRDEFERRSRLLG